MARISRWTPANMLDGLGIRVARAAAVTPQTAATAYFTVSGGRALLVGVLGQCTVVFTATATNIKLTATPTVGSAVDLCAVLAAGSKEAGTLFGITGLPSDAMVGTNAGLAPWMSRQIVVNVGTIDFNSSGNNTSSQTKWDIWYIPLDPLTKIVAA